MRTVVSLVSYSIFPAKMGGQKGIALFYKYLAKRMRLICVTVKNNDTSAAEGYEIRNILSDSPLRYINLFYFFTLRRIVKKTGASVLLLEQPYYGWLAVAVQWFTKAKLVIRSHNIESHRFRSLGKWWWRIMWWYERFTHRQAHLNAFIHDADREYAVKHFGLDPARCITISYAVDWHEPPSKTELAAASQQIREKHGIAPDESILLFNGAFDYKPNLEGLQHIINTIHPWLQKQQGFKYRIVICGRNIPDDIAQINDPRLIIAGFVNDISIYFKGADVFLNPMLTGGGIKTKLVEALGSNLNAVSTDNGAIGVDPAICNGKLFVSRDGDWETFCKNVLEAARLQAEIPPAFFRHFDWNASLEKLEKFL